MICAHEVGFPLRELPFALSGKLSRVPRRLQIPARSRPGTPAVHYPPIRGYVPMFHAPGAMGQSVEERAAVSKLVPEFLFQQLKS